MPCACYFTSYACSLSSCACCLISCSYRLSTCACKFMSCACSFTSCAYSLRPCACYFISCAYSLSTCAPFLKTSESIVNSIVPRFMSIWHTFMSSFHLLSFPSRFPSFLAPKLPICQSPLSLFKPYYHINLFVPFIPKQIKSCSFAGKVSATYESKSNRFIFNIYGYPGILAGYNKCKKEFQNLFSCRTFRSSIHLSV